MTHARKPRARDTVEEALTALCATAYILAVIIVCIALDPTPDRARPTSPAARTPAVSRSVSRPGDGGSFDPRRDQIGKLLARLEETRP
jgi:hypothetical protein